MTELTVGRMAIRCRGPSAAAPAVTACRSRLQAVGGARLAAALDRALDDLDVLDGAGPGGAEVIVDRLTVPLTFDPRDHDDETIALLWAEAVRAALVAHLSPVPPPGATSTDGRPESAAASGGRPAPLSTGAERAGPHEGASTVHRLVGVLRHDTDAVAALLADRSLVVRLLAVLGGADRRAVLHLLAAGIGPSPAAPAPDSGGPLEADPRLPAALRPGGSESAEADEIDLLVILRSLPDERPTIDPTGTSDVGTGTPDEASPTEALAVMVEQERAGRRRSAVGGVILLYPWLEVFLDGVVADHPRLGLVDARRLGLVALAAPDLPELAADPMVRLLAGDLGDGASAPLPFGPLDAPDVLAGADVVYRRFARALPGFEESSVGFLRDAFVGREASLEQVGNEVHITLAPRPLDIVLERLAYPLGIVSLPWTPTMVVARERS